MKYHIEQSPEIEGHSPYLRVLFEGFIDKDVVQTWLRSADFIRQANADYDDNNKTRAIVYPYQDTDINEFKERVDKYILSFIQNLRS